MKLINKIFFIICILFISTKSNGQILGIHKRSINCNQPWQDKLVNRHDEMNHIWNLPHYDEDILHFGFIIALNQYNLNINRAQNWNKLDSIYIIDAQPEMGFNLGIISNLHLGDLMDLRFTPQLIFASRTVNWGFRSVPGASIKTQKRTVESTLCSFPLHLKFKSRRLDNFRAYVMGGANYTIDLASGKKLKNVNQLAFLVKQNDVLLEAAVGFDFYLEYFKFSPELKFSWGVKNMLYNNPNVFTNSVNSIYTRAITLSFLFE